jgi:methylenetetrahydrofolate dehydrogenase (NADP+)/methenyltetrahydrofolate cyclohydrolase
MATILDGRETSNQIKENLKEEIAALAKKGVTPCLAGVLVGEDPGSASYIKLKEKSAEALGIRSAMVRLPPNVTQAQLMAAINRLNRDDSVHGIFLQLPLPAHLDENPALNAVLAEKDVDGFRPENVGKAWMGQEAFLPATPLGIDEIIRRYGYDLRGKHAVIVNLDNLVGKPLASMWAQESVGAAVTLCPPSHPNLSHFTNEADILVVAVDKPRFITADMVKTGVIAIDFGANYIPDPATGKDKLVGDLDFDGISAKAEAITPVPGGIGPMTVTMLMMNTVKAARRAAGLA